MNCPKCNAPNAYVGFSKVECHNSACQHYTEYPAEEPLRASDFTIVGVRQFITDPYHGEELKIIAAQPKAVVSGREHYTGTLVFGGSLHQFNEGRHVGARTNLKRWNMTGKDGALCRYVGWMDAHGLNVALIDTFIANSTREMWVIMRSRRNGTYVKGDDDKKLGLEFCQHPGSDAEYATKKQAPRFFEEIWNAAESIPNSDENAMLTNHYEKHSGVA